YRLSCCFISRALLARPTSSCVSVCCTIDRAGLEGTRKGSNCWRGGQAIACRREHSFHDCSYPSLQRTDGIRSLQSRILRPFFWPRELGCTGHRSFSICHRPRRIPLFEHAFALQVG